mgnify:CR=1 FL=1
MKLAVISNFHANLHAVEAVMDDLDHADPEFLLCLDDLAVNIAERVIFLTSGEMKELNAGPMAPV